MIDFFSLFVSCDIDVVDCFYIGFVWQIYVMVVVGVFEVGVWLLLECSLVDQFGVSCMQVCEVIIVFEVQGIVEVWIGLGIYVLVVDVVWLVMFEVLCGFGLIEMLCVCGLIEVEVVVFVVIECKDVDFDCLFFLLMMMCEQMNDKVVYDVVDCQFYL